MVVANHATLAGADATAGAGWFGTGAPGPRPAWHTPVEGRLAQLEGAEAALLLAGPDSAMIVALTALTNPGGHLVVSDCLAGPARDFLDVDLVRMGCQVTFTDCTDTSGVAGHIRPETQLVLVESLTDPAMALAPLNELAALAHGEDLMLVVENTALSAARLRPLDLGAAVVVERGTPYLDDRGGPSVSVVAGSRRHISQIRQQAVRGAAAPHPHASRLLEHSLRTLEPRMAAHEGAAEQVARFLRGHPGVARVRRPAATDAPWLGDAAQPGDTLRGFGGLLSFLPSRAPASDDLDTMPPGMSYDRRHKLVRVLVGTEDPGPLIRDLERLLAPAEPGPAPR